jgi:hypothetical protein
MPESRVKRRGLLAFFVFIRVNSMAGKREKNENLVQVNSVLTRDMLAALDRIAKERLWTRSIVVREAVKAYLNQQNLNHTTT